MKYYQDLNAGKIEKLERNHLTHDFTSLYIALTIRNNFPCIPD